jgi:hypothetical protein
LTGRYDLTVIAIVTRPILCPIDTPIVAVIIGCRSKCPPALTLSSSPTMTTSTAGLSHVNLLSTIITRPLTVFYDVVLRNARIFTGTVTVRLSLASSPLKVEKKNAATEKKKQHYEIKSQLLLRIQMSAKRNLPFGN